MKKIILIGAILLSSLPIIAQTKNSIYASKVAINREVNIFNPLLKADTVIITIRSGKEKIKITEIVFDKKIIYLPKTFPKGKAIIQIQDLKLRPIFSKDLIILN